MKGVSNEKSAEPKQNLISFATFDIIFAIIPYRVCGEQKFVTLVVARRKHGRVSIVSDTLLTQNETPLSIQHGVIKSCILPGNICVSFDNSPDLAGKVFLKYTTLYPLGTGFAATVSFFKDASRHTGNDFLIVFGVSLKIVKISDGNAIESVSSTSWIGDQIAYERFREYEANKKNKVEAGRAISCVFFADDPDSSPSSDLYSTMRQVVRDRDISGVGGFVAVISKWDIGFRHSVYCDMLANWPEEKDDGYPIAYEDNLRLGASDENSEFSISQFSTGFIGVNIVGFYVLKAKKAFVFYPSASPMADTCKVLSDVEPGDLKLRLSDYFKTDLEWLLIVSSIYSKNTKTQQYIDASQINKTGMKIPIYCHANTFPK